MRGRGGGQPSDSFFWGGKGLKGHLNPHPTFVQCRAPSTPRDGMVLGAWSPTKRQCKEQYVKTGDGKTWKNGGRTSHSTIAHAHNELPMKGESDQMTVPRTVRPGRCAQTKPCYRRGVHEKEVAAGHTTAVPPRQRHGITITATASSRVMLQGAIATLQPRPRHGFEDSRCPKTALCVPWFQNHDFAVRCSLEERLVRLLLINGITQILAKYI